MRHKLQYPILSILCLSLLALPMAASAKNFHKGDVLSHLKFIHSNPNESADVKPIGGELHVNNINSPSLDVSYFLDDEIAVQFIPVVAQHSARLQNTTRGDRDLGKIWVIAPTAILQYHYEATDRIKPYVGIGISYATYIEDDDVDIEYESGFAGLVQAGVDIAIDEKRKWWANLDAKKAWAATKSVSSGGRVTADDTLNPLVLGAGVGYKF